MPSASAVVMLALAAAPLAAQHAGHDTSRPPANPATRVHLMAQAVPLVTRAAPVPGGGTRTEAALTQTILMARAAWWRGRAALDLSLDAEGLTMPGGELSLGAFGEGFLDRAEWARTMEHDHLRREDAFAYETALVEGALRFGGLGVAIRLEQTERPEEERDADRFRAARPHTDLSILGITRWRAATVHAAAPPVTRGTVAGVPFLEVSRLAAAPRDARALFAPADFYGSSHSLDDHGRDPHPGRRGP